jgi:hypothetical protein
MRVSPRPEAVAEPKKVDFVYGAQHLNHRALEDLVLECRNAKGPAPTVGFRDVGSAHRLWPIPPSVDPITKVPDVAIQVLFVVRHRYPIQTGARRPSLSPERSFERFVVHVVQQCREAGLARSSRRLVHLNEFGWQRSPALCPVSRQPAQVPLRSGPSLGLARCLRHRHQYYAPIRHPVSAQSAAPVVPCYRLPPATIPEAPTGLPRFRRVPFIHEMALDPGRAATPRLSAPFILPSP